jgi:NAD(P)-dependent dehydrogenase (short-subunit alcohol dehydrogenase family)
MKSLVELGSLKGKVAVVSGGAGHVGQLAAETLAELGASTVLLDNDSEGLKVTAKRIEETYQGNVTKILCDLCVPEQLREIPDRVLEDYGRADVLVNAAGLVGTTHRTGWITDFEKQELGPWREAIDVNLSSIFLLAKGFRKALGTSGKGVILNVGSIYGSVGPDMRLYEGTTMGNPAGYAASKGGVLALTKWFATVLAPNVRANLISPGGIWRGQDKKFHDRYIERTPLARMATEEDLKGAIAYLTTDLSAYVTGHDLVVDGGWTAW